jgi:hypothetical protein
MVSIDCVAWTPRHPQRNRKIPNSRCFHGDGAAMTPIGSRIQLSLCQTSIKKRGDPETFARWNQLTVVITHSHLIHLRSILPFIPPRTAPPPLYLGRQKMDPINQRLESVNSQQNLTTAEVVKLIVEPLLQTMREQRAQMTAQSAQITALVDRIQALVSPNKKQLP